MGSVGAKDFRSIGKGTHPELLVRFRIPDDTTPGLYRGKILAQANGISKELPIEVRVFPFRLAKDNDLSVGLYYSPPDGGQFALLDKVNDFQAERDRRLQPSTNHRNLFL